MVFALAEQLNVPPARLVPFTSTDLAAGNLEPRRASRRSSTRASRSRPGAGATALQAFVNGGGNYVGYNDGGATSAAQRGHHDAEHVGHQCRAVHDALRRQHRPCRGRVADHRRHRVQRHVRRHQPARVGVRRGRLHLPRREHQLRCSTARRWERRRRRSPTPTRWSRSATSATRRWRARCPAGPTRSTSRSARGTRRCSAPNVFFRGWTAGAQRLVMNGVLLPDERRGRAADEGAARAPAGARRAR